MAEYPCTSITIYENIVVLTHGPYISTFSFESGALLQSTVPSFSPSRQNIPAASFIMNIAVGLPTRRLVSVDQQKSLKVWDLDTLEILSSRELPKKAHQVLLTDDGTTILVADKFGDVFAYPLVSPEIPQVEQKRDTNSQAGRKSLASHSNPSLGTLVLGHTSSLTTMLLTPDDKCLITADRDEHIRVSQYPKGYNIERFCMGHTKYVSALHLPQHAPGCLLSAGGDRDLFLWDYQSGEIKDRLPIGDIVYAATKVKSQRRKFKRLETKAGTGWRARKRREREVKEGEDRAKHDPAKAKQESSREQTTGVLEEEDVTMAVDDGSLSPIKASSPSHAPVEIDESDKMITEATKSIDLPGGMIVGAARARLPALEDIIVVSHISTLTFESQHALVFSAIGANALFFASFDPAGRWGPGENVHQYNFPYPVLDFDVERSASLPGKTSRLNRIWITLDSTFVEHSVDTVDPKESSKGDPIGSTTEEGKSRAATANGICVLEWQGGNKMIEVTADSAPLLGMLGSLPSIPASKEDIQALDLYGLLTSLPKTEELEEPDAPGQEDDDFAMEKSGQASLAKAKNEESAKAKGGSQQVREVKKSGRKKWQDKIEARSSSARDKTTNTSNGRSLSPSRIGLGDEQPEARRVEEHVKVGEEANTGKKGRRANEDEVDAGNSGEPATKKLRTDGL